MLDKIADAAADSTEHAEGPGPEPVDILIVDDNAANLLALETALAPLGANIVRANSGCEALRHLLARDFATVILDVNMPDMDGFETARMMRSRRRSATTPIIFTSAVNTDETDTHRGYSLGAVDYICAPVAPEVLRAKVAVFIELHRKSEENRIQAERLRERTRQLERSQQELRLSERMASVGTLCAGLGHDMGNLLLPLSIWIDAMRPDDLPPDLREGMQNLRTCVQYLRKLAAGLRLVSLDPSEDMGACRVHLREWLDEVEPILRNILPRRVVLETDIPRDLPAVCIAPHRLAQVVFNLVQNAGEALIGHSAGVVRLWAVSATPDAGIRLGVSDNGQGMSRKVLERCTDPFFTTKTRGISTGLGLSLVHGIIQSAGSKLEIGSSLEKGTTFSFVLAAIEERSASPAQAIITVRDPRAKAVALAMIRSVGVEIVQKIRDSEPGPAIWITDNIEDVEGASAFREGRSSSRVFILTDETVDAEGVSTVRLTGPNGLASCLRCFLAASDSARPLQSANTAS